MMDEIEREFNEDLETEYEKMTLKNCETLDDGIYRELDNIESGVKYTVKDTVIVGELRKSPQRMSKEEYDTLSNDRKSGLTNLKEA